MEKHYQLSDDEFEQQFENCFMNPSFFSHEAHIRLAWIHVRKYGVEKACNHVCTQIQKFDRAFDEGLKYNKTVTVACVKAVNHFVQQSTMDDFRGFIREFPRLKTNFRELLDFHYGFDIYNSEQAKMEYLKPDLIPFE